MPTKTAFPVPIVVLSVAMFVFVVCLAWFSSDFPFDSAAEGARQVGTVADMQVISEATKRYHLDHGTYARFLPQLRPYVAALTLTDGWGTPYVYAGSKHGYVLISLGGDAAPGPEAPEPWTGAPFEADVVLIDGAFLIVPRSALSARTPLAANSPKRPAHAGG